MTKRDTASGEILREPDSDKKIWADSLRIKRLPFRGSRFHYRTKPLRLQGLFSFIFKGALRGGIEPPDLMHSRLRSPAERLFSLSVSHKANRSQHIQITILRADCKGFVQNYFHAKCRKFRAWHANLFLPNVKKAFAFSSFSRIITSHEHFKGRIHHR